MDFSALPADEQDAVREKQRLKKLAKRQDKVGEQPGVAAVEGPGAVCPPDRAEYRTSITSREYFQAAQGGRVKCGPATEANLERILAAVAAGDEQARVLESCNYFQFQAPAEDAEWRTRLARWTGRLRGGQPAARSEAVWDPIFNARLAYEGFFTITTGFREAVPLPELQPFYSVLLWPNFENSKHVRKALARARRSDRRYRLANCKDPARSWALLEGYHRKKYGSNWLTRRYFDMMRAASADPSINFKMHCIELYDEGDSPQGEHSEGGRDRLLPLAGEVGFSVGSVYTSLSGWTGERTSEALGTLQLALLGRWLQERGYGFWSLGHCYSPEMDYKRQLGHRIYPRKDFLTLLSRHRGTFRHSDAGREAATHRVLEDGASCDARSLLEAVRV